VDDTLHRLLLVLGVSCGDWCRGGGLDLQVGTDEPGLDGPAEEAIGDEPGGWAGGLLGVEMLLFELAEVDPVICEPVEEFDRDSDGLLGCGGTCLVRLGRETGASASGATPMVKCR
jgi:hypothetical protein